jgi:hypothetical protein
VVVLAGAEYGRLVATMEDAAGVAVRVREALPKA